jgi:hypothetical protein
MDVIPLMMLFKKLRDVGHSTPAASHTDSLPSRVDRFPETSEKDQLYAQEGDQVWKDKKKKNSSGNCYHIRWYVFKI